MKWTPILQILPIVLSMHQWEAVDDIYIYTYSTTYSILIYIYIIYIIIFIHSIHMYKYIYTELRTYIFESYLLCLRCFFFFNSPTGFQVDVEKKNINGSSML